MLSAPLVLGTSLAYLLSNGQGLDAGKYGRVRVWGSVGFILTVVGLGWLFEVFSLALYPWILLAIIAGIALSSCWVPDAQPVHAPPVAERGGFDKIDGRAKTVRLSYWQANGLGDGGKVRFTPLNAQQRFTALQAGTIDVLSRNTSWTLRFWQKLKSALERLEALTS